MALVGTAKRASSSVSWTKFLVADQHLYHQFCWNLAVHRTYSQYVGDVEDGDGNANGKIYTEILHNVIWTSYMMYFVIFVTDETDLRTRGQWNDF